MSTSLVPSSSAAHGITATQNVARDVFERIERMRAKARSGKRMAWGFVMGPIAVTAMIAVTEAWPLAFLTGYLGILIMPVGIIVNHYRKRELKSADRLDRQRDVAWVSPKDGLVFFADDGLFVQKRGGFKPYGVEKRAFRDVTFSGGELVLHGRDEETGTTYQMEIAVPPGWTEDDTLRVRGKLDHFLIHGPLLS